MAALDFLTGVGIPFESNGVEVLEKLVGASEAFTKSLRAQTAALGEATTAMAAYAKEARAAIVAGERASASRPAKAAGAAVSAEEMAARERRREAAATAALRAEDMRAERELALRMKLDAAAEARAEKELALQYKIERIQNAMAAKRQAAAEREAALRDRALKQQAKAQKKSVAEQRAGWATVGGPVGVGALAVAAGGAYAVTEAGKLQQTLLSIKNETGATNAQMGDFYNAAMSIANQNGMSPEQGGEILRSISRLTAGQFSIAQMQRIAPSVATFASMIHFNRPEIGVDDAAKVGLQTAHLFRAYQPEALEKLLDKVYRLSGLMAEKPDAALRQMSYYEPLFKGTGVDDNTSIALMALLDRAGFRNKVGTNVRAELLQSLGPLQLTQHSQQAKMAMLTEMGLFKDGKFQFNTADGGVNYLGELAQIGDFARGKVKAGMTKAQVEKMLYGTFGSQGGTIAALFADPQMVGILKGIQKYLADSNVSLAAARNNRDAGLGFQFERAVNNFTAVMTELSWPWLTELTGFFKGVGDQLHAGQSYLHSVRSIEQSIQSDALNAERFFKIHEYDFKKLGDDTMTVVHSLQGLATVMGTLASASLSVYGSMHRLADYLAKTFPFFKPPTTADYGSDGTLEDQRKKLWDSQHGKPRGGFAPNNSHGAYLDAVQNYVSGKPGSSFAEVLGNYVAGLMGLDPNLYSPSATTPLRQRMRRVAGGGGGGDVTVNGPLVQINGAGEHDPRKLADAAGRAVQKALQSSGRRVRPQHALSQSGSILHHPMLPRPLTHSSSGGR